MTGRESRKARRQAERKARKLEPKEAPLSTAALALPPAEQPKFDAATRLAALQTESERELENEFGREFLDYARATGDRIARRAGLIPPHGTSFRNTPPSVSPGRCTGPRTPEGKLASSRNSLKHGLSTGTLLIPGEDPADFEALRAALHQEHQPADLTEQLLVDDLAQSHWLRQRALRLQNDCFTADGGVDEKRLALFLRYGTAHERAFHKALTALMRIKKERLQDERRPTAQFSATPRLHEFVSQSGSASASTRHFVSQNAPPTQLVPHPGHETHRSKSPASGTSIPHAA